MMRLFSLSFLLVASGLVGCNTDEPPADFQPGTGSAAELDALARVQERANQGDHDAEAELIVMEDVLAGDAEAGMEKLRTLAEGGNARAAGALGNLYLYGTRTAQSDSLGRIWLERAAALGDSASIALLNDAVE